MLPAAARADAGVLVPYGGSYDPAALSLENMDVRLEIDNQMAHVSVLQVFRNHTDRDLEGQYTFIIPEQALISAFAVWDEGVRIPGVIMEKQRARRIYEEIVARERDPGLFESLDDESMVNEFSCRVFPIPAYGTKRLELEYDQQLEVDGGLTTLAFPLKPTLYGSQQVGLLEVEISIDSSLPLADFTLRSPSYPLQLDESAPNRIRARIEAAQMELSEDLVLQYALPAAGSKLDVLAFRDVESVYRDISPDGGLNYRDEFGFFLVRALFNLGGPVSDSGPAAPRHVVFLLDTSLSMQWDKLDRALEALELLLRGLRPADSFSLVCFNSAAQAFQPDAGPQKAEQQTIAAALAFVRTLPMSGGTDLKTALERGLGLRNAERPNALILISDGQPTLEDLRIQQIVDWYDSANSGKNQARTFAFGVGDDTNGALLKNLVVKSDGAFSWVMNNEDPTFKAERLSQKLDEAVIEGIALKLDDADNLVDVYPQGPVKAFDRSLVTFVGRYREPGRAEVQVNAVFGGRDQALSAEAMLPKQDTAHPGVRRLWAKARVDYLLERIRLEGEKDEWIAEIIALSKQFTFVTPYTSFLAAPRSLLRPRVIKPGDPLLRVHTDEAIVEVVASFPFGLVKPLQQIGPGLWQIRFLAPANMDDGSYVCRLYLRDRDGRQYVEDKAFVIDSRPPELRLLDPGPLSRGQLVRIAVRADRDTRRLTARLAGGPPAELLWDEQAQACVGALKVPADSAPGRARLQLFAEDFAHNTTSLELPLEVR